jgi:hypothetical protein
MINIRSFSREHNQIFYFDFSLSDIRQRGAFLEGVRVTVAVPQFDENQRIASADLVARRRAGSLLRSAIAELRRTGP